MKARLSTDGGARGNPGPAAYGFVLEAEDGTVLAAEGKLSPFAARQQLGIGVRWSAAHNSFIQVGAELGIPGLVLFLGIIASAFGALRRSGHRARL